MNGNRRSLSRLARLAAGVRGASRLCAAFAWTLACWVVARLAPPGAGGRVARGWMRGFMRIAGLRLVVVGTAPRRPFFLVSNHVAWFDFFPINAACPAARAVMMAEAGALPIVGRLFTGLDPIYVRRVRGDTLRVQQAMIEALGRGESLLLAPEATVSGGREVLPFHAALLEPAIATGTPVHYVSMTCRTPEGWPTPSRVLAYPDVYLGGADGGRPPSFLLHLLGIMSLPYAEVVLHFGPRPLLEPTREGLANRLRDAVRETFVPFA